MKNLSFAILVTAAAVLTSCHYGTEDAQKTLERNDLYKGDKAEYSVNRAGDGGYAAERAEAAPAADSTAAPADTTAAAAPAPSSH